MNSIEICRKQIVELEKKISYINKIKTIYLSILIIVILFFSVGTLLLYNKLRIEKINNKQLIIKNKKIKKEIEDNKNKINNIKELQKQIKFLKQKNFKILIKNKNKEKEISKDKLNSLLNVLYQKKIIKYNIEIKNK